MVHLAENLVSDLHYTLTRMYIMLRHLFKMQTA